MAIIQILIADSSSLAVYGAEMLLRQRQDTQVSVAWCVSELLKLVASLRPEIILLGEQIDPAFDTLALVEHLQQASPTSRIMIIGCLSSGLIIHDLLAMGVRAYLNVNDDLRETLLTAVEVVLKERLYLSPTANAEYLISMQFGERNWKLDTEARSVLRLLTQGYTVGRIASQLKVKPRRVYWVREKLRYRFGAITNEHLISRAITEGFRSIAD